MDDIVKRIRQQSYFGLEPYEAANEIEQLRQRAQKLEKQLAKNNPLLDEAADAIDKLTAERDALKRQRDHIKMQARLWKLEASAQAMTVRECYQACTGSTGEPGDWNGALPVLAVVKERNIAAQYWQIAEGRFDALKSKIDRLKYIMASNAYKDGATLSVEICVLDDEAVGDFSERIYLFVDRAMGD